jgi:PAS domain S-box-containing protein
VYKAHAQKQRTLDSLYQVAHGHNDAKIRVQAFADLCWEYKTVSADTALLFGNKGLVLARKMNDRMGESNCLTGLANVYFDLGKYEQSLRFNLASLTIRKSLKNNIGVASNINNIGIVHETFGDYEMALDYYLQAYEIRKSTGDQNLIAASLNNIGAIYFNTRNFDSAAFYYAKSIEIKKKVNDEYGLAYGYLNLATVWLEQKKTGDSTLQLILESNRIFTKYGDNNAVCRTYVNAGDYYWAINKAQKAIDQYEKGYNIVTKTGYLYSQLHAASGLAKSYAAIKNYERAYFYECLAREHSKTIFDESGQRDALKTQFNYQQQQQQHIRQLEKRMTSERDKKKSQILFAAYAGLVLLALFGVILYFRFKSARKQKRKLEQLNRQIQENKEQLERLSIVASETENVVLIMDAGGKLEWVNESFEKLNAITLKELIALKGETIFDISNNPNIRQIVDTCIKEKKSYTYESLNMTRDGKRYWESSTLTPIFGTDGVLRKLIIIDNDVTERKDAEEQIKQKNKDITDSINYALRIQKAILPSDKTWKQALPDSFVLYMPKDIVAGDFYFLEQINNQIIVAAADCTGHGVPGAMVSVVCSNALTRSVKEFDLTGTGKILDKTRELVLETFLQSNAEVKDGMDIGLISLRASTNNEWNMEFSGAHNPVYIIRGGSNKVEGFPGDKQPVGISDKMRPFVSWKTVLKKGDCVYLLTDGYQDQFGGNTPARKGGKKFKAANLQKLLVEIHMFPMQMQHEKLQEHFEKWKGDFEQVDDVCIIGVKI